MRSDPTLSRLASAVAAVVLTMSAVSACSGLSAPDVVATPYPLAWLSQRIAGPDARVVDLTPPGVEAHDASLTAAQRGDLQAASVVVYLGDIGFQPDVEQAVAEADGVVVDVGAGGFLPGEHAGESDPHAWLDPIRMAGFAAMIADGLSEADPDRLAEYAGRDAEVIDELTVLDEEFREGLADCRFDTFVVTHEAFGYLATRYGLRQLGIHGLTPEAEPTAAAIQAARDALDHGEAAPVVFFEDTDEGRRIGEAVAADAGAESLPLTTLESQPADGDYLSAMRDNLASLRQGLECR